MECVLANVPVNGPVIFCDWARQECSWSYVSLCLDGNQSDVVLFVNRRWELILMLAEYNSLVNSDVELGFVCVCYVKNLDTSLVSWSSFINESC
jgi:hypothetical protein